ncbi:MAG: hypothetical protein K8R21_13890 [Leptospira sp.]|nr:hypothetical protein [Leptospira sp.]
MNRLSIVLFIALFLSIATNLFLLIKLNSQSSTNSMPVANQSNPEPGKILSVYIMPHPPSFLEGRTLQFKDYKTENRDGKKFIVFREKRGDRFVSTKVDSEAVRWK